MSFLDTIGDFVSSHADRMKVWTRDAFSSALAAMPLGGFLFQHADTQPAVKQLIQTLIDEPGVPPTVRDQLLAMQASGDGISLILANLLSIAYQIAGGYGLVAAELRIGEQEINARLRPELLTPEQLLALYRRQLATEGAVDTDLAAQGYRDEDIANLKALTDQLLDLDAVRDLFWRGTNSATTTDNLLDKLGYNEAQRKQLFTLFSALPSVDDHIRMAVRQVFNPDLRSALGLDEDYPDALTANIAKVGLSEDWARNIWAAHWEIPSPTQIFEMRFRGVIDEQLQNQALRDAGYSPLWRDKLLQINQRLVTRVDARRLFDSGIWDEARVKRHYQSLGYSDQDAADLANWTVRNATEGDTLRQHKVKTLTEQMVINALETYVIHSDTARELLGELNYTANEVDLLVGAAEYRRDQAASKELEASLKREYTHGQMPRDQVASLLAGAGYDSARVDRLLAAWDLLAQSIYLSAHAHQQRELTKADVLGAYKDGVMPQVTATQMLIDLGYPPDEVALLVANADVTIAKTHKADQLATIHYQFVNGQIDQAAAQLQLDAMNLRGGERDFLIAKWLHEAHRGTTNLTVQQLGGLFSGGIITTTQVRGELSAMGFSAQHVDWLARSIIGTQQVGANGLVQQ